MSTGVAAPRSLTSRIVDAFLGSNFSVLLILLCLGMGAVALIATPREEDPQIVVPFIDVFIETPGTTADETAKLAAEPLESGDKLATYAEVSAQNIHLEMPPVKVERLVNDGDRIRVGELELEVWHTPGHTNGQLAFRLDNLLFSGDNLFRDGCVGAIDAHHGSSIQDFIKSLQRIRASDVEWLLPSHGPVFRKDDRLIDRTIARLETYLHMADFGTCAIDWPLIDEWEDEIAAGKLPS